MKQVAFWVFVLGLLAVTMCDSGSSSAPKVTQQQVQVLNRQIDTLHEEIAASRSPAAWALLALVASIAVPIVLGVILLHRAERTALHGDEVIREVARRGLTGEMIDTERLLDSQSPVRCQSKHVLPSMRRLVGSSDSEDTQTAGSEEDPDTG